MCEVRIVCEIVSPARPRKRSGKPLPRAFIPVHVLIFVRSSLASLLSPYQHRSTSRRSSARPPPPRIECGTSFHPGARYTAGRDEPSTSRPEEGLGPPGDPIRPRAGRSVKSRPAQHHQNRPRIPGRADHRRRRARGEGHQQQQQQQNQQQKQ